MVDCTLSFLIASPFSSSTNPDDHFFSSLTIGHLNSSFYSGDVNFIALSDNGTAGFWQIAIDDVQLNGVSLNSSTTVAVVDSFVI